MLYKAVELPSEEPVQFVGCYVLKWGKVDQPSLGFVPIESKDVLELLNTASEICYDMKIGQADSPDRYLLDSAWSKIRKAILELEAVKNVT